MLVTNKTLGACYINLLEFSNCLSFFFFYQILSNKIHDINIQSTHYSQTSEAFHTNKLSSFNKHTSKSVSPILGGSLFSSYWSLLLTSEAAQHPKIPPDWIRLISFAPCGLTLLAGECRFVILLNYSCNTI